jgi:hypothetical protein
MFMPFYPMPKTAITMNPVVQLPKTLSYSTNKINDMPIQYQDVPEKDLCALIEGNIFTITYRDIFFAGRTGANSFDPVYLCDLPPDILKQSDFSILTTLASRIIDKSDDIFFDDGMDD